MNTKQPTSAEDRERMIAEAAYFRALERDFAGGDSLADWLSAEREIDAKFMVAPHDSVAARLYERLAEANDRIHELATKLKRQASEEWTDELARIHKLRDVFAEKLDEVREHTGQAKQNAKRQADKLWKDLAAALDRMGEYHHQAESSTRAEQSPSDDDR